MKTRSSTTSSITESPTRTVLKELVSSLEKLQLLETIYGYVDGAKCRIIAIADNLSGEQRDSIWTLNLDYQSRHPEIDVDIRILQRRGRALSDVFEDNGTALIVKHMTIA